MTPGNSMYYFGVIRHVFTINKKKQLFKSGQIVFILVASMANRHLFSIFSFFIFAETDKFIFACVATIDIFKTFDII